MSGNLLKRNVVARNRSADVAGPDEVRPQVFAAHPGFFLDRRTVLGRRMAVAVQPGPDVALFDLPRHRRNGPRQGALPARDRDCSADGVVHKATDNTTLAVSVNNHRCLTKTTHAVTVRAMLLGQRVAAARDHAKLTQAQLAKRVHVTQQTIQKLESGAAKRSSALADICLETGVSLRWLARGEGQMMESHSARPDPTILANAVTVLKYLAEMQAGAASFLYDAPAILAVYDEVARDPSQALDLAGASRRMAAVLRGRGNDGDVERGKFMGAG